MGGGSASDEESIEEVDYSQTMPVETYESESDDARIENGNEQAVGHLSSSDLSWTDINSFQSVREVFCDVQGPQSGHSFNDMVTIFQNIFDKELVELIVAQMNLYMQQYILVCGANLGTRFRVRKWEDVTIDKLYMVIALFMLMGIIQKPTLQSYFSKNWFLETSFLP
jgi:uncharacterized membrane protein